MNGASGRTPEPRLAGSRATPSHESLSHSKRQPPRGSFSLLKETTDFEASFRAEIGRSQAVGPESGWGFIMPDSVEEFPFSHSRFRRFELNTC